MHCRRGRRSGGVLKAQRPAAASRPWSLVARFAAAPGDARRGKDKHSHKPRRHASRRPECRESTPGRGAATAVDRSALPGEDPGEPRSARAVIARRTASRAAARPPCSSRGPLAGANDDTAIVARSTHCGGRNGDRGGAPPGRFWDGLILTNRNRGPGRPSRSGDKSLFLTSVIGRAHLSI
jgi:hypothetical protein